MQKKVDMSIFLSALAALNPKQREAVEAIEGPVIVVAGPGTGKTQILTLRIANILLKTDLRPENILALTFTDSGAKAMRERLRRYIGSVAYQVPIFTFHGFAERLIAEYPDAFSRIIGGRAVTDVEQVEIMEQIISGADIKVLRPLGDPTYYVRPLISMIGHLKQEYVSPDALLRIIATQEAVLASVERVHTKGAHKGKVRGEYTALQKSIEKNRELQYVYRAYEAVLQARRLYDFNDMIIEAVEALETNEDLLRDLQETYQYILADEHQDVNGSQNKILEVLSHFHDTPNIFVVGDEKQAIYRFQGASLENFMYFTDTFTTVKEVMLTENYRSGQAILDCAQALITVDDERLMALRVPLTAEVVTDALVSRSDFSHQAVEDDWVVEMIKQELSEGVAPSEVAVIVRTNKEVESLTALLRKSGVPVSASADGDILTHPITTAIEALMNAVLMEGDESALCTVLHGAYWGIPLEDIIRIQRARDRENPLIAILADDEKLKELGVRERDRAKAVVLALEEARKRAVTEAPHRVIESLLEESGFLDHVMKVDPTEGARVVRRLYDEIEAMVVRDGVSTLDAVRRTLALRRRYQLPLQAPYITTVSESALVMTAHRSKGLEFSTVFIPHIQDNNWGGKQHRNLFQVPLARYDTVIDPADDERRLLYVAFTRAKKKLYLSTARETIEGRAVVPSRLLGDITPALITMKSVGEFEERFSPVTALRGQSDITITRSLLKELLKERGLSATSLNNLIKNPWDFLYRNLLRIPEVKTLSLQFGTVVHAVLEKVTAHHTEDGEWPAFEVVISWLEGALRRQPLSPTEYAQLHEKGLSVLATYLTHLERGPVTETKEELSVRVLYSTEYEELPELSLTGKLDRIDLDEAGKAIRIVDYKTGKPKTRAAIEGETAEKNGSYKRQIAFYALLLSLNDDDRYETRDCVLSFVEPTTRGEIKEESFTITDEEIEQLRSEINDAVANFCRGTFLTDRSLAEASAYAHLATQVVDRL